MGAHGMAVLKVQYMTVPSRESDGIVDNFLIDTL